MLLSLLLLQVQPLGNAEFGFQPVPYLKTFSRGRHQIYAILLNTLFHPGIMLCNQVIPLLAIQTGYASSVASMPLISLVPSGLDGTTSFSTQASKEINHQSHPNKAFSH